MQVDCKCGNSFKLQNVEEEVKQINGRSFTFATFKCPACGRKTEAFLHDSSLKEKIDERKKLMQQASNTRDLDARMKLIDKAQDLRSEIERKHVQLKKKYNL